MLCRAGNTSSDVHGGLDDLASLSRAEPLARDLTRQVAALEEQLAAAEAALPTALSQASEQAGAALIRLGALDAERARFEETVKTHLDVATQLASRLGPPRARLRGRPRRSWRCSGSCGSAQSSGPTG